MEQMKNHAWHRMSEREVLSVLKTDADTGLEAGEAQRRRELFGENVLKAKKGKSVWLMFLSQFHQPLVYLLMASGVVTYLVGEYADAGVIFGVVLLNALIGGGQELKAVRALEALARSVVPEARVMRGGRMAIIPASELTLGDVVFLNAGDKVPAGLRLLFVRDLSIDESALTGESVPVKKDADVVPENALPADRKNLAYASTSVVSGNGCGVVVAVGADTEIGRISALADLVRDLETPLSAKVKKFTAMLLYVISGLAALTFLAGMLHGWPCGKAFVAAAALAVAAVPEGLPAAFTIILAVGVSRMVKRRAVVRELVAAETLGSTTVVCSDKTGTLTENQMTVQAVRVGTRRFSVSGSGFDPDGEVTDEKGGAVFSLSGLKDCLRAGMLCNDSSLEFKNGVWSVCGDPTEGGLIVAARKFGLDIAAESSLYPRIAEIPFESERRYMATLHKSGTERVVFLKGAVEVVLKRCDKMKQADGTPDVLDESSVLADAARFAEQGMRVLAFAEKRMPAGTDDISCRDVEDGFVFSGLQAISDPPRTEAVAAVAACRSAGIRVVMITGDHALTAAAIARRMNLDGEGASAYLPRVLTGDEIALFSDEEMQQAVREVSVFARVTPEQKLKLVRALQDCGEVVAMTGDGVNDAPALKQSNIGVAMGKSGTDVARETSDIVLTDDNFATIEAAVEEGRCVFDNLMKFIVWTLPVSLGESLVLLAAIFTGMELPVSPLQILWVNLAQTICLGFAFAVETKEPDVMVRPPRDPAAPIVPREFLSRVLMVSSLMMLACFFMFDRSLSAGKVLGVPRSENVALARTTVVNTIVLIQIFYMFNCRSLLGSFWKMGVFSNKVFWAGIASMLLLQIAFTYAPVLNTMFKTAGLSAERWAEIVLAGLVSGVLIGLYKRFFEAQAEKNQAEKKV